jgi:thiol-disulfide isomerase/thioredoxin
MKKAVCYTAAHCGPCKMFKPVLKDLAEEGYNISIIPADEDPLVASMNDVYAVPTTIIYKALTVEDAEWMEIERFQGAISKKELKAKLK